MTQNADHLAAAAGEFEPQRQNNFSFEATLDDNDKELLVLSLSAGALPTESNDEIEISYQNQKRYVAGMFNADGVSFTFRDYADKGTRIAIMRWRKLVHNKKTGATGLAKDYKKEANIIMTAPDGSMERVCILEGTWPQAVTGGTLDMSSADPVMIEVTFRFDKPLWVGIDDI